LTASLVNTLTTDPNGERISEIPNLSAEKSSYKDFKVIFNGGIDSKSSIKSFKWLTNIDTSALQPKEVIDSLKSVTTSVGDDVKNIINSVKDQKETLKSTANELKNLFKF
jgi:hypothetical protein